MKKIDLQRKLEEMFPNFYSIDILEFENGVDLKYRYYAMGLHHTNPIIGTGHVDHLGKIIIDPDKWLAEVLAQERFHKCKAPVEL